MATKRFRVFFLTCAPMVAFSLAVFTTSLAGSSLEQTSSTQQQQNIITPPAALEKPMPETIEDLEAIQAHVKRVVSKVMPAVVNVKAEGKGGQGSGVVISEDGLVMTAAHVITTKDGIYILTFPDGKKVKSKALGTDAFADSGLLKILDEGKYPFCEVGKSGDLKKMNWCIAIGHPGGLKPGRTPPVRLGRIVSNATDANNNRFITTECTLVGGDSGGPLFDVYGRVIGIHSRIGNPLTSNMHIPSDAFKRDWGKLVAGERWGNAKGGKAAPEPAGSFGASADLDFKGPGIKMGYIAGGSAAEKAGLKLNDIITSVNAKTVASASELQTELQKRKSGDEVTLEIRRGTETLKLKAVMGAAAAK